MKIVDNGDAVTITSEPWLIAKIFVWFFLGMSVLFPLILVVSIVSPPREATIDCDRAKGSCTFAADAWTRTVSLAELSGGKLVHHGSTRNSSSYDYVNIELKNGQPFYLTQDSYHDDVTAGMRVAVDGLNGFLAGTAPSYQTHFRSTDDDWVTMIGFTISCPFAFWAFSRLSTKRTIELERGAKRVRVRSKTTARKPTFVEVPFAEVKAIRAVGARWSAIYLDAGAASHMLLYIPRTPSLVAQTKQALELLTGVTGAPLNADADFRKWAGIAEPSPTPAASQT